MQGVSKRQASRLFFFSFLHQQYFTLFMDGVMHGALAVLKTI
jgi:hypothetical protein